MNKYFILKSIDEAIVKCGQRLRLNENIKNTFNDFAKSTRGRKTEKCIITDDEGNILKKKSGSATGVEIEAELFLAFWDENHRQAVHIEHNHPNKHHSFFPVQLSGNDINRLLDKCEQIGEHYGEYMVKSITCEDSFNHSRMTLVRGEDFTDKNIKTFNEAKSFLDSDVLHKHLGDFHDELHKEFTKVWENINPKPVNEKDYDDLRLKTLFSLADDIIKKSNYQKDLVKAKKLFRNANCRLDVEWVDD